MWPEGRAQELRDRREQALPEEESTGVKGGESAGVAGEREPGERSRFCKSIAGRANDHKNTKIQPPPLSIGH